MNNSKIVVDSSVAIKWFISQNYSFEANQILETYKTNKLSLIAPDLIYAEMGNIIWKIQRFQGLNQEDAENILNVFQKIPLQIISGNQLLQDAYKFAIKYQRSIYDSLYVVLSVRENCRFISADEKLYNAIHQHIPNIKLLKDWKNS
ncbi:type II toxin-antitoxin system VapC family toxin [Geminocystis sp. CENA526]|uniref:type II toxin-antitoxin system VapC family toxin n=1 Tax=Geminocystis sp. CENA526 TaxID=1355871 RepID=UPI003D6F9F3F